MVGASFPFDSLADNTVEVSEGNQTGLLELLGRIPNVDKRLRFICIAGRVR